MKIKTFEGTVIEIEPDEIYIKPFYDKKVSWALCTNSFNKERILVNYSEKHIADYALKILNLMSDCPYAVDLLPEEQIRDDIYLKALGQLKTSNFMFRKENKK